MAAQVLTNVQLLVGASELGPFSGEFSEDVETSMKDANNFAALGYRVVIPGLTTTMMAIKGHSDFATGAVNAAFGTAQRGQQFGVSIMPVGSASVAGDPVFVSRGLLDKMTMYMGATGEVADFAMSLTGDTAGGPGFVAAPLASRTTAGLTGTAVQCGAVSASQRLYANLHITAAAGTNLAVKVQSAPLANFAAPTDRITFSTVSAVGWQWGATVGGTAITDTWWRALVTIASVTFTFAVNLAIV